MVFFAICHLFYHNTDLVRFSILLFFLKVSFPKKACSKIQVLYVHQKKTPNLVLVSTSWKVLG